MQKVLELAARYPGTFTVYGYTALQHWIAPHLRRLPGDLDLVAAVKSADDFRSICQEVAGVLQNVRCTEQVHDGMVTCHMRSGAIKVLDLTMESLDQRQALASEGHLCELELEGFRVMARSERWFFRQIDRVLVKGSAGLNSFRWHKDLHHVHMIVASMAWTRMSGSSFRHTMPWYTFCKYDDKIFCHSKPCHTLLWIVQWHMLCRWMVWLRHGKRAFRRAHAALQQKKACQTQGVQTVCLQTACMGVQTEACVQAEKAEEAQTEGTPAVQEAGSEPEEKACMGAQTEWVQAEKGTGGTQAVQEAGVQAEKETERTQAVQEAGVQTSDSFMTSATEAWHERRLAAARQQAERAGRLLEAERMRSGTLQLQVEKLQSRQLEREAAVAQLLRRMEVIYGMVGSIPLNVPLDDMFCNVQLKAALLQQCGISGTLCVDIRKDNVQQFTVVSILAAHHIRQQAERIMEQVRKTLAPLA